MLIAVVAAIAFAWHKGWIQDWLGTALDSGAQSVKRTQQNATRQRPADPGAPEEKK